MEPTSSPYIEKFRSKIAGWGIRAAKDIPKGTRIIEYVGEKITKKESERRSDLQYEKGEDGSVDEGHVYIFTLNSRYDIDGNVEWNTARLINHSCDPNCETTDEEGHIWIEAIKDIKKGTELTYNYGYDVDNYHENPCCCGTSRCVGYIVDEDQWPKLKKLIKRKKDREKRKAKRQNK